MQAKTMMNGFRTVFFLLFFFHLTLALGQQKNILLKTDAQGTVIEGSIDKLIQKIQEGKPIRVGWQLDFDGDGTPNLEHWVDANFLSILNGHVFNQIEPIYAQIPSEDTPQVQITASQLQWTAIIGTNGKLISRYVYSNVEEIEDESERNHTKGLLEISERMVATIWASIE